MPKLICKTCNDDLWIKANIDNVDFYIRFDTEGKFQLDLDDEEMNRSVYYVKKNAFEDKVDAYIRNQQKELSILGLWCSYCGEETIEIQEQS